VSEVEVAVCPRCARPFGPGADYCTHCGGQLGIAETTIPYIPVPNSARFSEEHEAPKRSKPMRPVLRAVGIFVLVQIPLSIGLYGTTLDVEVAFTVATILALMAAVLAWLYFTLAARRARSGGLK
jgi:hypothetical protein